MDKLAERINNSVIFSQKSRDGRSQDPVGIDEEEDEGTVTVAEVIKRGIRGSSELPKSVIRMNQAKKRRAVKQEQLRK